MSKELKEMTPRAENYSQWYNDLVVKADLAEQSAVRGCMVIKPYGYAIWETIQAELDRRFKDKGVKNASSKSKPTCNFRLKESVEVSPEGSGSHCGSNQVCPSE